MHQRTWLSLLTFPLVGAFTMPLVVRQGEPPKVEGKVTPQDPLSGVVDIQDVLTLVRDNYVDSPDMDKVLAGGIQGALERAHPLNAYLTPEDLRLPDPGPAGPGLRLVKRGIYAQVLGVTPGGPAEKAGFQVGDVVRKLDGKSIGPLSAWTLERSLRGPEGSELVLHRYGAASGQVTRIALKRERPVRPALTSRKDPKALLIGLPDLSPGRAQELRELLGRQGASSLVILDLRGCCEGTLSEAAKVAGLFLGAGSLATVQAAGAPEVVQPTEGEKAAGLGPVAVLQGLGSVGPAEALVSAMKRAGLPTLGERTAGLGVERSRISLRQGGAVELVTRRWVGAGEEKLDRQGVAPELVLRGLKPEEDPIPKVLEALDKRAVKTDKKAEAKSTVARRSSDPVLRSEASEVHGREVA